MPTKKQKQPLPLRKRLERALNDPYHHHFQYFNDVMATTTLVSILVIILETEPSLQRFNPIFLVLEVISVALFSAEYLMRLYAAPKRWKYVFSFFGIIDLLAVVPSLLHLGNLMFLKSVRVLRILRMLRMVRLSKLAALRGRQLRDAEHHVSIYKLNIQIYLSTLVATLIFLGTVLYVVEDGHAGFESIPMGIVWVAGQVVGGGISPHYPETVLGEIVTLLARFSGFVLIGVLLTMVNHSFKHLLLGGRRH